MRVLIVEDDALGALVLQRAVSKGGHQVELASSGSQALEQIGLNTFDAVLVDLILPGLDGISLIKVVRQQIRPAPLVIVTTSLTSPESRTLALEAGADDYVTKPYDPELILERLEVGLARRAQVTGPYPATTPIPPSQPAAFSLVAVAAGSGGPTALRQIFRQIPEDLSAAFFVVQQAPAQILETLMHLLRNETRRPVELAEQGAAVRPGHVYIAPADRHLVLNEGLTIELNDGPLENYLRPSANPLFRSVARLFGSRGAAVVLSGLGIDGGAGAAEVAAAGGLVLAQDPREATDPSMPRNIIDAGLTPRGLPLGEIVTALRDRLH